MLTEHNEHEESAAFSLREKQEREIALGHSLARAEHELALEAFALGQTFARAGLDFDPLTFVALRIVEGSREEHVDPVACLNVLMAFGVIDRSVAQATDLLEDAA